MKIRFFAALYAAKLTARIIDIVARGRGTNLPGQIALKIDPKFVSHIKGLDPGKTIFVTGTNGKSTTTNLMAHIFKTAGIRLAVNLEGANLIGGVVVSLLKNCGLDGRLKADLVLMETDERFLPIIYKHLPARHLCITNIQKDQVQRNGEPEIIRRKISSIANPDMTMYVNGDEPNALSLAADSGKCIQYGVEKNSRSFDKNDDFFSVSMPCPKCHEPIRFETYNVDNIGPFACDSCGFETGKNKYMATDIDFENKTFTLDGEKFSFAYSTPYFLYSYVAALTVAKEFGISYEDIRKAFPTFELVGGRMESIRIGNKEVKYIRMKQENPETLQSAINVIAADKRDKVFMLGLGEIMDFDPYYTNTFYTWDCDFRELVKSEIEKCICFSDKVVYDAAIRLLYDGMDDSKLVILPTNDDKAIVEEVKNCDSDNIYLITLMYKFESLAKYVKQEAN